MKRNRGPPGQRKEGGDVGHSLAATHVPTDKPNAGKTRP